MHLSKRLAWFASPLLLVAVLAAGLPTLVHASAGPPVVSTTALPAGEVDVAYSQTLAATDGTSPYTWAITAGALPDGLALNGATGVISGTPTTAGTGAFTVQVTDSATPAETGTLDLTIAVSDPVAVTTTALDAGTAGTAYEQTLVASGGVTPYGWSITTGALPAGLSLNGATGVISGTPATEGTSTFTVEVTDLAGGSASQDLAIAVLPAATLTVTTTALADGTTGTAYEQTLTASGGLAPYSWSISAGTLPDGLTLDAATGVISGTPTAAGDSAVTVAVTDSAATPATSTKDLSIVVDKPASEGSEEVLEACADTTVHPALPTLCRLYTSGKLPPFAQHVIGRVILKIADHGHPNADRKHGEHDEHDEHEKEKAKSRHEDKDSVKDSTKSKESGHHGSRDGGDDD